MKILEMPLTITGKDRFGVFIGLVHAAIVEAGIVGLGLFVWVLISLLRRR